MRKPLAERHLEDQTTFPAVKMQFFFPFFAVMCSGFLTVLKVMVRNGVSIGICQNNYRNLDARGTECVGRTIFSVIPRKMQKKTKNNCLKDNWNIKAPFPCPNACFMFWFNVACQLHYKNGKKTKVHIWECFIPVI
jgi:hypothetical protein